MNWNFDIINFLLLLTAGLNFGLGVLIYSNNKQRKLNRLYGWNILAIISWIIAMFLFRSASQSNVFFLAIILYITPTLIASSFLYFTYFFPTKKKPGLQNKSWVIFSINLAVVLLTATPGLVIQGAEIRLGLENTLNFGSLYIIYVLYILSFFLYGFYRLIIKYTHSTNIEKVQIIYLLIGYGGAANIAFVTNLILPWAGVFAFNWLGQVATVLMVGLTTYAIIAHRMMDIKLALRKSVVTLSSFFTVIILAVTLERLSYILLPNISSWVNIPILAGAIYLFPILKNKYFQLANKYFFTSLYDSHKIITDLSNQLNKSLQVRVICGYTSQTLINSFHSKALGVLIKKEKQNKYHTIYNNKFPQFKNKNFAGDNYLNKLFVKQNEPIVVEEVLKNKNIYYQAKKTIDLLIKYGVAVVAPLNIKNKTIGLIALGEKETGDIYNSEDLKVLKIISSQVAIALQNAILYEEQQKFGERLKKEVNKATADLREANKHLRKLDKAKTEFISITSHQLRTPLTGLMGYLTMILDGDFGRLKKSQQEIFNELLSNTGRLIRLVNVFLNVSRIELGRLVLNKSTQQIEDLVESSIQELKPQINKRGLITTFHKTSKKIPPIQLDKDKIKDVILNLIGNAIKYTNQGKVSIQLKKDNKYIIFSVTDTGVGFTKQESKTFFKKFSRGEFGKLGIEGSGLGLFIAKNIIQAHQGKTWCESKGRNKGSTFYFTLPIN